jgi:hypothetical protein
MMYCAPVYVPWTLGNDDNASQARKKMAKLKVKLGTIAVPATIVEQSGKILLWHLPNLLSGDLQVGILFSLGRIHGSHYYLA